MSAVLDTVRSFSSALSEELVQAVKSQDASTVEAFNSISEKLEDARMDFLSGLKVIEQKHVAEMTRVAEERAEAMKNLGAKLDAQIDAVAQIVAEVRARYADKQEG